MSVRQGLLALLSDGPKYGAQLRAEFEERTGGSWPLNVGQVYTTLGRLERDGLVAPDGGPDEEGRIGYRITDAGRAELDGWWADPVGSDGTPRNELAIKLALAVTLPGVDVPALVHAQRTATMARLRALTRQKATASAALDNPSAANGSANGHSPGVGPGGGLSRLLVIENLVYAAESEIRWLDHVEARVLARSAAARA
ncbi:DNA-binding PadR family transcriptional regulator [Kineosphaera limosa]|uniref:Putative PadR family transcriptional regulator n=1 Tax=Kineosphaera limosa NBRC 100340 TaxID=1184609 RepID=K6WT54_9MICO|nr:PadR family transcriptional regulator [Kineosphaera limosa]NYE00378.1 DNA-binding PadR family transcriptional regulator [Kineosphaera limosa]GAB97016.1 putative PadR family transcriptional regulator [Kineosphaera limosa NBRC 100340]